jgi:hypothetical protein
MHQQRPVGRHGLGHAGNRRLGQRTIERQHALVGGIVDVAGKFHRDGAIATRQKAGRGKGYGHGLIALRKPQTSVFWCPVEFACCKMM